MCVHAPRGAIYWTNNFSETIGRANLDGTGVDQNFITGGSNLVAVTVHGDYLYWTNVGPGGLGNAWIGQSKLDGSQVHQQFILAGGAAGIAADRTYLYWTNDGEAGSLGGGQSVGRAKHDGTGIEESFITGANNPNSVAVNDTHIYWANAGGGTIGRANLDGTGVNENFITGVEGPQDVKVADGHIYWATLGFGTTPGSRLTLRTHCPSILSESLRQPCRSRLCRSMY